MKQGLRDPLDRKAFKGNLVPKANRVCRANPVRSAHKGLRVNKVPKVLRARMEQPAQKDRQGRWGRRGHKV